VPRRIFLALRLRSCLLHVSRVDVARTTMETACANLGADRTGFGQRHSGNARTHSERSSTSVTLGGGDRCSTPGQAHWWTKKMRLAQLTWKTLFGKGNFGLSGF
jgi:hypothetical protein